MKGILCATKATTNEEFKQELEKKKRLYFLISTAGVIMVFISVISSMYNIILSDTMQEVFSGMGFGLMIVGGLLTIKAQYIIRDENWMKKERLNNSDERNIEISNRSFRSAAWILIFSLYLTGLVGSVLIDERLFIFVFVNVLISLVGYLLSYNYFNHKL